jgi:hypothetical protein
VEVQLVVIALGCFLASIVNAALATGGIYITLAATTAVLPVGVAIPLADGSGFAVASWAHLFVLARYQLANCPHVSADGGGRVNDWRGRVCGP